MVDRRLDNDFFIFSDEVVDYQSDSFDYAGYEMKPFCLSVPSVQIFDPSADGWPEFCRRSV